MRTTSLFIAAAFAFCALAPATALAGSISDATGPVKVNDATKTLGSGQKLQLEEGDRVETGKSTVTWTSDSGEIMSIEAGSSFVANGAVDARDDDGKPYKIEYLFLEWGTATGEVSYKTSVGTAAGWMTVPRDQAKKLVKDKATVFVDVPKRTASTKSQYRSIKGTIAINYNRFSVYLFERHSVVLTVDPAERNRLGFRTGQQNPGEVEIRYDLSRDNRIVAYVPRATSGTIEPEEGNKTKIAVDLTSLKTGKVRVETRFGGREPKEAQLGPGTSARIDNETGDIQVTFESVAFEILESAIMLTSEFSTIAQSNFADVK